MTAAVVLFVFGAITAGLALQFSLGTLRAPGSGLFPLALGVMLMGLAAGQAILLYRARPGPAPKRADGVPVPWLDDAARRVLLFMCAVAFATALLPWAGYAIGGFILVLALLRILGERRWKVAGSIAAVTAIACYVVFVRWLNIPLPSGWFWI